MSVRKVSEGSSVAAGPDEVNVATHSGEAILRARVEGDGYDRIQVLADGSLMVGNGVVAPTLSAGTGPSVLVEDVKAASYVLGLGDADKVIAMNVAGAGTVTVPSNAAVALPVGTVLELFQLGVGATTITAAGGVTLRAAGGRLKLTGQYSSASLRKRAADEWVVAGDLTL